MCGEIVTRGEEVVSFGWCFWHRGCFGCLLCGALLTPPGIEDGMELEKEDEHSQWPKPTRGYRGVELESIPLCSWCDNTTEEMPEKDVLQSGIKNVTKMDNGWTRERLNRLTAVRERTEEGEPPQKPKNLTPRQRQQSSYRKMVKSEEATGLIIGAEGVALGEDGNIDALSRYTSADESPDPVTPPEVYVSIFDALGEPSFRPAKMKPLPKWMSLLPSSRRSVREDAQAQPLGQPLISDIKGRTPSGLRTTQLITLQAKAIDNGWSSTPTWNAVPTSSHPTAIKIKATPSNPFLRFPHVPPDPYTDHSTKSATKPLQPLPPPPAPPTPTPATTSPARPLLRLKTSFLGRDDSSCKAFASPPALTKGKCSSAADLRRSSGGKIEAPEQSLKRFVVDKGRGWGS